MVSFEPYHDVRRDSANKGENSYGLITNARYNDADDSHVPKRLPRSNPSGGHPATDNDRNDAEEERASDIRHAGGEAVIEDELISTGSES